MPASEDRAEHVSLLRWQLEPESARTARVTKQSPVPVTAFLTCAALFFTACVGVLVVGSRPAVPGVVLPLSSLQSRRDASAAGERALMESLRFDERWYDQGNTLDAIKIDHEREGLGATSQADFPTQAGFEAWRGAPYWQHFREIPVSFNRPAKEMRDEPLVVVGHATDDGQLHVGDALLAAAPVAAWKYAGLGGGSYLALVPLLGLSAALSLGMAVFLKHPLAEEIWRTLQWLRNRRQLT